MFRRSAHNDYETVSRSRSRRYDKSAVVENRKPSSSRIQSAITVGKKPVLAFSDGTATWLKKGHAISFATLFVFTIILYARPAEFYPSALTNSLALIIGAVTLATFLAAQIPFECS